MRIYTLAIFLLAPLSVICNVVLQENPQNPSVKPTLKWMWYDCGEPEDAVHIKSIEVSPDPPKPGENMTVTVKADVTEEIEEGAWVDVLVQIGVIKLPKKSFDVCEEARNANASVTCPVKEDNYTIVQTIALPSEIPRARYLVQIRGFTVDDDNMVCVELSVDFRAKLAYFW